MVIVDKRIGTYEVFPKTTIMGKSYSRPCSSIALGHGYIAVIDETLDLSDLDELKAIVAKSNKPNVKHEAKKQANVHSKDE